MPDDPSGGGGVGWIGALVALASVLGGLIGAAGKTVADMLMNRHKARLEGQQQDAALIRQGRADAIKEWQEYADRLERRVDVQEKEIYRLYEKNGECERRAAQLEGEIRLMQSTLQRVQMRVGDEVPALMIPGIIIADIKGRIVEFSPSLTPLFHWMPQEVRGKNIEVLIPERLRAAHREAFAKVALQGHPPWTERSILTYALTKDGDEVPVSINLSAWQAGNTWMLSAQVRGRPVPTSLEDHAPGGEAKTEPPPAAGGPT